MSKYKTPLRIRYHQCGCVSCTQGGLGSACKNEPSVDCVVDRDGNPINLPNGWTSSESEPKVRRWVLKVNGMGRSPEPMAQDPDKMLELDAESRIPKGLTFSL